MVIGTGKMSILKQNLENPNPMNYDLEL